MFLIVADALGVAKGMLDEAVLWTMLTSPRAEGGARAPSPLATPLEQALALTIL